MKKAITKSRKSSHIGSHATEESDHSAHRMVKDLSKSLLFSTTVGLLLLIAAALIAYFSSDPDRRILPLAFLASGLTAFLGGIAAVRIHGSGALLCGLLNGGVLMLLMMLASIFFIPYASGYRAGISCLLHVLFLCISVAGGFVGLKKRKNRKKR